VEVGEWKGHLACVVHVPKSGGTWERVKQVGKLVDPSGGTCRRLEAWTVADLFRSRLGASDLSFREERGAHATPEWAEIAQIHRFRAETPLLVVLFVAPQILIVLF
jgi:hypothetical protein